MGWEIVIFVPVILFMVVVAPIWIVLHYRSASKTADGLSSGERGELEDMIEVANNMAERIENLESILDVESPDWRSDKKDIRNQA
ncbi:MAG: envelope stress response membrane protein PspB [Pseudomonadales bacterium]|nr:envelope stress response membrane protein PspB [Pseudomonadales bacterium]